MARLIYSDQDQELPALGGKIDGLVALGRLGLAVPAWIALAPPAGLDLSRAQSVVLTPALRHELAQALTRLCPNGESVAVRSSALEEDGPTYSFAGQLDSFLEVPPAQVVAKVLAVWRSAVSERALAYRREHGLSPTPPVPAVLIQRMVPAEVSGVAFSADPVSGRRGVAVVAAGAGLGAALVAGQSQADTYRVNQTGQVIEQEIAAKAGRPADGPVLTPDQARAIAQVARQAERFLGRPQDLEWAIAAGQLYLLQTRPITTLRHLPDPDGRLNLWDNSNIAESYPGLTTPLTFSFARRAYEEVYRQFCRMMGVPAALIAANHTTFRHMLGLIRGRVYYNLLSWYRVLALLPGYRLNRRFMEQMMGVKEGLPDALLDEQQGSGQGSRLLDGLRLGRSVAGLVLNYLLLPRRIAAFYGRLEAALGSTRPDLSGYRPDQLVAYYRDLEGQLLSRWDAPLLNDFFTMIFYGLLRKLSASWLGEVNASLANALVAGTGAIISAEPAGRLTELARLAAVDPAFVTLLESGSLPEILTRLPARPDFERAYQAYLDKFGERCLEELKLESPTLHDDPLLLLRMVGQLARSGRLSQTSTTQPNRQLAEERVRQALKGRPLRGILFRWVLNNTRRLIRQRENLRFERTRLFGRARLIFLELGRRFAALDLLAAPRDIFYLEVEEILGFVGGTSTTTDLRGLVALRQAEFTRYRSLAAPADRFETRGIVLQGHSFQGRPGPADQPAAGEWRGLGCSPGLVRGPVRVVSRPQETLLRPGEILLARRTDPGWIILFPAAAGLLVEHGSVLSHTAIVSRELGLPAVVSIPGLTAWLKDGDWVEMDGSSGVVRKLGPREP